MTETAPTKKDWHDAITKFALKKASDGVLIIDEVTGERASWIFDFRALLLQPKWLDAYAELFWQKYGDVLPFQVGAMESAGVALVAAIVVKSVERGTPINGFYIRKSRKRHGLTNAVEGAVTDDPVILVDDLIHSGSTFLKQIKILEDYNLRVIHLFTLMSYSDPPSYTFAKERGIPITSYFKPEDFGVSLEKTQTVSEKSFEVVWRFQAPNPSHHYVVQKSAPVIDDRTVYFGTDAGIFYALDQKDGRILWNFTIGPHPEGKGIFSSPALSNGTVYFGAYDGNVYALDSKTGERRWVYEDADWIGSSPAIAENLGVLFIGLEFGLFRKRGGIAALSLTDGRCIWQDRTPEYTHGSPLYIKEENMIVIGSNDGVLYAYNARTGSRLWHYQASGEIKSAPAYDPKRRHIIFGTMTGICHVLDVHTGRAISAKKFEAGIYSVPLIYNDTVFVSSLDKNIYALDLATLEEKWRFETNGRIFASPIVANGSLWIGSDDGQLRELDMRSGGMKTFFQFTERITNKITSDSIAKQIFVSTNANEIYCIQKIERG